MDKNLKADSKKSISIEELKQQINQGLIEEESEEKAEEAKAEAVVENPEQDEDVEFVKADNSLENLNIEDLIAKYMPPEDLKFAERISLSDVEVDPSEKSEEETETTNTEPVIAESTDKNVNEAPETEESKAKSIIEDKGFDEDEMKQILSLDEDDEDATEKKKPVKAKKNKAKKPVPPKTKANVSLEPVKSEPESETEKAEENAEPPKKPGEEIDDTDIKLMYAFGMDDELEKTVGKEGVDDLNSTIENNIIREQEKEKEKAAAVEIAEFTSAAQIKSIIADYKRKYNGVMLKLLGCLFLLLASFLLENINPESLPAVFNYKLFTFTHIMFDLQLIVLGCAMVYKQLLKGLKSLATFKPSTESVTVLVVIASLIYEIAVCLIGAQMRMYGFAVIFCVFMTLAAEYMNLKREIYSFNIAASKRVKYAITKIPEEKAGPETEAFRESLPESPELFKIERARFIDGFFAKMKSAKQEKSILKILLPAAIAVSFIFFVAAAIISKNALTGISQAYITLLIILPFSVFVTYSYPFYAASREAYGAESAILGEESLEKYSKANAVSFEDKDVFPSYGVKVRSVKVYGSNRIDIIIYNAASIFMKINGPLSDVFEVATQDLGHSKSVEIVEVDNSGIEAAVDGRRIYIGKAQYIHAKGFMIPRERDGENEDGTNEICTMYMTLDDELAAKMYVQYVIDPDFEQVVKQLAKTEISVGIKTLDPNINDQMLSSRITISKYPVKVLKIKSADDVQEIAERTDSGIISKGSAKSLLSTLSLCEKVLNATKNDIIVKVFAAVVSVLISAIILALGMSGEISSFLVVLYHVFWLVPIILIARMCIGKI